VKKIHIEGEIGVKRGTFAQASGEEANNREKAREVYSPLRTTSLKDLKKVHLEPKYDPANDV